MSILDHKEIFLVVNLVHKKVIDCAAVLIAHHAVENLTVGSTGHVVYKNMADEFICVGTAYAHLPHMAHVKHSHVLAHCVMLFGDARILDRHIEPGEGRHQCPQGNMTVMQTRLLTLLFHVYLALS